MNLIESDKLYKMDHKHRGYLVIIDNFKFEDPKIEVLEGHEHDVQNYIDTFKKLNFKISLALNQTKSEMIALMEDYASRDYTDHDCIMIVFLSHGEIISKNEQYILGWDKEVNQKDLINQFFKNKTLFGKPKIIIFDLCRGGKEEP